MPGHRLILRPMLKPGGALAARYTHCCIFECPCSACCGFCSLLDLTFSRAHGVLYNNRSFVSAFARAFNLRKRLRSVVVARSQLPLDGCPPLLAYHIHETLAPENAESS